MAVIAIFGLGLIGGSLALDLMGEHQVRGCEPDEQSRQLAAERGIAVCASAEEALAGADLAVLCAPLGKLAGLLAAIAPHVGEGTVVTDVGGTKAAIAEAGQRHLRAGAFVGGHPMAGTTERGFTAARPGLFDGAPWALTPTGADREASRRVQTLLAPTRARFFEVAAQEHDESVAFTSHLPYLLSVALARSAQGAANGGLGAVIDLVGPGFRDTTRLAMTPPALGKDMAFGNRDALLEALAALRHQLAQAEILLQNDMDGAFGAWTEGVARWRAKL